MIYASKPQRGGRQIPTNTNNPPQDPPSAVDSIDIEPTAVFIPIENTAPPVPEIIEEPIIETPIIETPIIEEPTIETPTIEEPIIETPIIDKPILEIPKVSIFRKILSILLFWRRK